MKKRTLLLTISLVTLLLIISAIFLFFPIGNMGKFSVLLFKKRFLKWAVILLVSLCVSISTISFQTIVQNRFLTPGVLGIESVFVLFQTMVYWGQLSLGMETAPNLWISMLTIVLQMIFFFLIYRAFNDLLSIPFSMLLFICLAFGTLFRSLSTFVQVLMDPNEFDKLQGKLFPSFQRMHHQSELVIVVVILTAISVIYLIRKHMVLNVFHLGKVQAQILGVNVAREEKWILLVIVLLTSLSTTLVGPMQFLGFMIANVTYQWIKDYRHLHMWTIAFLLGSILLLGGQLVIEKLFHLNIPISVVIEWFGGLLYFVLLLKGRYRSGIKNIHKAYDTVVVDSVSLTIPKNQLTAFIGPNGAGKSTLVSIMSRLLQKDSGQLWIKGKEIEVWNSKELAKELSVLKQNQSFQVSLTVEELVSFGRYPYSKGKLSTLDYQMIDQALKHTNLLELRDRSIQTLSGGQMQRVFIAMVLAQDTDIVLLDEPLNHLDLKQAVEIMKLLRYMVENLDKTVVIVMHDLNMAINFSDYLVAFKEGKCEFHGKTMDVVTNQTLSELYEIDIEVIEVSGKKYITVK